MFLLTHSSVGGAQEIWINLAEAFHERGYDTRLVALYPPGDGSPQPAIGALEWTYASAKKPASPLGGLALLASLVRLLRRDAPDIVFTALPAAGILVPIAAQIAGRGVKVVTSHHTPVSTYSPLLDRIDGWTGLLPSVHAIVSVSTAVSDSLSAKPRSYRSKVRVIHNSLPPTIEKSLSELAAERVSRSPRRSLIAIGRLAPQKNYPVLLRALARLEDVELTLVGSGPEEASLRALAAELGITPRVTFAGHKSRLDAMRMLADSDVFSQPSLFEGHSLALIEASKLCLPLIVSRVPAQVEGVTDATGVACGIIVDPQDDEALAAEVARLLEGGDHLAFWTERSRQLGEGNTFARTVGAYETLLAPGGGKDR